MAANEDICTPRDQDGQRRLSEFLFANNIFWVFVSSQSQEDRLPKLVVAGPLGKFDLGDQNRLDPHTAFHDCWRDALSPSSRTPFWQVQEGACSPLDPLHPLAEMHQGFCGETSPHKHIPNYCDLP
jgi:hypothetical protein